MNIDSGDWIALQDGRQGPVMKIECGKEPPEFALEWECKTIDLGSVIFHRKFGEFKVGDCVILAGSAGAGKIIGRNDTTGEIYLSNYKDAWTAQDRLLLTLVMPVELIEGGKKRQLPDALKEAEAEKEREPVCRGDIPVKPLADGFRRDAFGPTPCIMPTKNWKRTYIPPDMQRESEEMIERCLVAIEADGYAVKGTGLRFKTLAERIKEHLEERE